LTSSGTSSSVYFVFLSLTATLNLIWLPLAAESVAASTGRIGVSILAWWAPKAWTYLSWMKPERSSTIRMNKNDRMATMRVMKLLQVASSGCDLTTNDFLGYLGY
jgi:hypothetical protein